jgi:hypothetical protein
MNANTEDLVTIGQPKSVAKVLDALPGMIGGIDRAIFDVSGKKMPFVLLIFGENGAMHASNMAPVSQAVDAIKQLAKAWEADTPQAHVPA